jgi:hypothetical protein
MLRAVVYILAWGNKAAQTAATDLDALIPAALRQKHAPESLPEAWVGEEVKLGGEARLKATSPIEQRSQWLTGLVSGRVGAGRTGAGMDGAAYMARGEREGVITAFWLLPAPSCAGRIARTSLQAAVVIIQILPRVTQSIESRSAAGHAVQHALNKIHLPVAFQPALRP